MNTHRTPKELIGLYWNEVWNSRHIDLVPEICADPIIWHDPNKIEILSISDQIERIKHLSLEKAPIFEHRVVHDAEEVLRQNHVDPD